MYSLTSLLGTDEVSEGSWQLVLAIHMKVKVLVLCISHKVKITLCVLLCCFILYHDECYCDFQFLSVLKLFGCFDTPYPASNPSGD
jgi:hypothetical protein